MVINSVSVCTEDAWKVYSYLWVLEKYLSVGLKST